MKENKRTANTCDRLKEAMALVGKTQADLVRETGLSKSTLSRYISGEFEPKQNAVAKLAFSLNVSEMWLWGYDVPMEKEKTATYNDSGISEAKTGGIIMSKYCTNCGEPLKERTNFCPNCGKQQVTIQDENPPCPPTNQSHRSIRTLIIGTVLALILLIIGISVGGEYFEYLEDATIFGGPSWDYIAPNLAEECEAWGNKAFAGLCWIISAVITEIVTLFLFCSAKHAENIVRAFKEGQKK